jgi:transcriptional regulator with XRE-family HTH domain
MDMPERSFGRTVRYRRTKLGLSQAKLAELVGRSTATIRSWERDRSRPNDPKVLSALAAILGVDERQLYGKAEVDQPLVAETSDTVEQALATLRPPPSEPAEVEPAQRTPQHLEEEEEVSDTGLETFVLEDFTREAADAPLFEPEEESAVFEPEPEEVAEPEPTPERSARQLVGASTAPAYIAPPDPYNMMPLTPTSADASYIEDHSQRQLYRVRTLATLVAFVALVVAFIWALGEGLGALGDWWDDFFGNLRL